MRKVLVLPALLMAVTAALATATSASASQGARPAAPAGVVVPDNNLTAVRLCSLATNSLCMTGHDGADGVITGAGDTNVPRSTAQDVNVDQDMGMCGGTVTHDCPFSNHTVDSDFLGDHIVFIFNSANGMDYHWDGGVGVVEQVGGNGEAWIQHGLLSGDSAGATMVNVQATMALDDIPQFVCSKDPGKGLVVQVALLDPNNIPARCLWQTKAG